jgi:pimeloyl-ACP methyl ester carboxylesterase
MPIVFVHGITDSHRQWAPIVERLEDDHRCIRLDLRGHGESGDGEEMSALAMARDVSVVVEATSAGAPALVGHSLGGVVVTAYAATGGPCASIVNVDQALTVAEFAPSLRPFEAQLRGDQFHETIAMMFAAMQGDRLPASVSAELAANRGRARQDVVLALWDVLFSGSDEELLSVQDLLAGGVTVPYLALLGQDAGAEYATWLTARMPTAVVETWPGDGHYLHLVEPDRFAARVREFVG